MPPLFRCGGFFVAVSRLVSAFLPSLSRAGRRGGALQQGRVRAALASRCCHGRAALERRSRLVAPSGWGGGFPQHQRKSRCPSWRRASAGDLAGDESLSGSLFFLLFRKDEVEDDGHDEHYGDAVLGENGAYDLGEDVEHVGSGGKAETDAQREGDDDHVAL